MTRTIMLGILLLASGGVGAQTASGKFTCDAETSTVESSVAAWVPAKKVFVVWGLAGKMSEDDLKALAYAEGSSILGADPKAYSDKAFQKAAWDVQAKARAIKKVMVKGYLKDDAAKVEWSNLRGGALMYAKCLANANLNFNMSAGAKEVNADIVKAFKSFDFPLKAGAKASLQTVAFKHSANPKGINTNVSWDYKLDAKVYVIE